MDVSARRALVIEDSPEFSRVLATTLTRAGYDVATAASGEGGLARARALDPDLVLVDLGLPGADGFEVVRALREFSDAYVLIVSGRRSEAAVVVGLEMGADGYVTKPVHPGELLARAAALQRRPRRRAFTAPIRLGPHGELVVDAATRTAVLWNRPLTLSPAEFDLLALLVERPGAVVTRGALTAALWGTSAAESGHNLDVLVAALRRRLGDDVRDPRNRPLVVTVRGVGFRFGADPHHSAASDAPPA